MNIVHEQVSISVASDFSCGKSNCHESSQIEITVDNPQESTNFLAVIQCFVKNLQNRYDLSPQFLKSVLTDPEWIKTSQNIFNELEITMLDNLLDRPEILELREIYHMDHPMNFLIRHMGWEQEECGHLIQKYDNGYQQYCNVLKYDHIICDPKVPSEPKLISRSERFFEPNLIAQAHVPSGTNLNSVASDFCVSKLNKFDHPFIRKTYQQMIDQKIFDLKYEAYQSFFDKTVEVLLERFDKIIRSEYLVYRFTLAEIQLLHDWLLKHPTTFRGKNGLQTDDITYVDTYIPKTLTPPNIPMILLK